MGIDMNSEKLFFRHLLLVMVFLAAQSVAAQEPDYKMIKEISYNTVPKGTYALERCKLDIYYPVGLTDCPVVVWYHGGGLTGGNKAVPSQLMKQGFVVVAVNYRLLPKVTIGECLDDCAEAMAWVFHHVGEYGGSEKKIFVSGHSAGGYITMMLGLDKRWMQRYHLNADDFAGLIPFSGQAISHFSYRKMHDIPNLQPTIDEFAPLFHVRKDAPPMILITGDRNLELFGRYEENAYLWRMLKLVGHQDVYLYEIDGHGHGAMGNPAYYILKNHIKRILGEDVKEY